MELWTASKSNVATVQTDVVVDTGKAEVDISADVTQSLLAAPVASSELFHERCRHPSARHSMSIEAIAPRRSSSSNPTGRDDFNQS